MFQNSLFKLCLSVLVAGMAAHASAQAVQFDAGFAEINNVESEMEQVELIFQQQVEMRLGELQRVCELSDSQIRKLEVAGKGAVIEAMDVETRARRDAAEGMGGMVQLELDDPFVEFDEFGNPVPAGVLDEPEMVEPDMLRIDEPLDEVTEDAVTEEAQPEKPQPREPPVEEEISDTEDDVVVMGEPLIGDAEEGIVVFEGIPIDADPFMDFGFGYYPISGVDINSTDIWTTAIERTLSDEQKQKYSEHVAQRQRYQRTSAVSQFIARVDSTLLLSVDQRTRLTELVDENYGEKLRRDYYDSYSGGWGAFIVLEDADVAEDAGEENEVEEAAYQAFSTAVEQIFDGNESQHNRWCSDFEPELTNDWGVGGFGGGGIFRP